MVPQRGTVWTGISAVVAVIALLFTLAMAAFGGVMHTSADTVRIDVLEKRETNVDSAMNSLRTTDEVTHDSIAAIRIDVAVIKRDVAELLSAQRLAKNPASPANSSSTKQ
jgi:hypothetical protein